MAARQQHFLTLLQLAAGNTWCPTLSDFDVAWGDVQGEGNGWRVNGEGGVHGRTSWNLLGGSIEFDMDACGGVDQVNNNLYTVSPEGGMSSGYCDIQSNDSPICMELDIDENNGNQNGATTWHVWGNKDGGCDQNGCVGLYRIDDSCKYHMRTEFHEDGGLTQYRNGNVIQVNGGPSSNEKNQIQSTLSRLGAAIISTQWTGWVPSPPNSEYLPRNTSRKDTSPNDSNGASFAITNLVVNAPRGIKFGPSPPTCSAPSPTPVPTPGPSGQCKIFEGMNNDGTNLHSTATSASSTDDCCNQCSATSGCVGFTHVHATGECWMKSAVDSPRDDQCSGCVTSGVVSAVPTPVPTPSPVPAPSPVPTPSPTPSDCPGGSLSACVAECPSGTSVFAVCVAECSKRCEDESCTGGDDGTDLASCCQNCPSDTFEECIGCCGNKFTSTFLI